MVARVYQAIAMPDGWTGEASSSSLQSWLAAFAMFAIMPTRLTELDEQLAKPSVLKWRKGDDTSQVVVIVRDLLL